MREDFERLEKLAVALNMEFNPAQPDVHTAKAAQIFGVAYDDVTPTQRRTAKLRNYQTMWSVGK